MTNSNKQASAKNYSAEEVYTPNSHEIEFLKAQGLRFILNQKASNFKEPASTFHAFTGKGGLHQLERKNFSSYYHFAQAKQKAELGQFFTPDTVCQTIVEMLEVEQNSIVADICSGKGSFFNYLKGCSLYGVEKDREAYQISKRLFPKAEIQNADMRKMKDLPACDYIVGNPPFDIPFYLPTHPFSVNGKVLSQSFYLGKAFKSLKAGGFLGFVCPYFKTPRKMTANHKVKKFFWKNFNVVAAINLPKGVFKENGTNIQTKVLILQKKPATKLEVEISYFQTTFQSREQVLKEWRESEQYKIFNRLKGMNLEAKQENDYSGLIELKDKYKVNEHGVVLNPDILFEKKDGKVIFQLRGAETVKNEWIGAIYFETSYSGKSCPVAIDYLKPFSQKSELIAWSKIELKDCLQEIINDNGSSASQSCRQSALKLFQSLGTEQRTLF